MSRSQVASGLRVIRAETDTPFAHLSFPAFAEDPVLLADPFEAAAEAPVDNTADDLVAEPAAIDPAVLEAARLEAATAGYQDGLAAGRADAIAEVRSQCAAVLQRLEDAVNEIGRRRESEHDELTTGVAQFAMAAVEALLDRELSVAQNPTRDAVERALRLAPDRPGATVVVNPEDRALLDVIDDRVGSRAIDVVSDPSVERGGCVVRVADCEIDAQLSSALTRLRGVLGLVPEGAA